ncbi:F-box/LRR-repeat protein 16 isoform X1 [Manis javanica]|uniref:F-box/LRR-repeat protein 16 isoform X1 n=1 Tax=Manis javanica TaxID=9974 RepID=UPI00081349F1|nr:F-box/LRR-repeat protein 16 isoform X4 [Manis javanica]XP_036861614.1 F-box/LRR-repeat protein 16 isoform X4 [Manis javanica]XP_036861615.1 F-box/LRR-repeat protein 16 isoform X4 [Manis javanica]XP_036861616.1 F-box/LRR-repeat protein 16 isoform X4 [Manis javanica]XP_036861617.1 F-box/LRR-repeat protein 16 isoform X4 [Manis javanica]
MSNPGINGDPKPPCLPRNGLVKLPGQPNGLGAASITKGTPAAKNRPCQPPPPPSLPLPSLAAPLPRAALAGGLCPPAGLPLGGPASAPVPGPQAERPPLATDEKILNGLFWYFSACEKCVLAQVCKAWRRVLYQPKFWAGLTPVLHAKELYNVLPGGEKEFVNLQGFAARGFEGFCLVGVSDLDICEFIDNYALSKKGVKAMSLKRSTITDAGLEDLDSHHPVINTTAPSTCSNQAVGSQVMLEQMQGVVRLELSGCNDFTEAGLWSSLSARITSLSVSDCINVADDAIAAISQLLPNLAELSLQAYHVTDTALAYFTARQGHSTHTLRLLSCWEITNHGVVNVVHSLPNLTALSLSGCSKVTDDGVELVAENLRKLRSLDLSWCPRITDMALEYVACDLHRLEELVLDRCVRITDTGLSYLSTMSSLRSLYLRWCCQVQDFGLKHLLAMRSLRLLSLAGCPLLTTTGLSGLVQLQELEELELTNCPGATPELFKYFAQHLPRCLVIE